MESKQLGQCKHAVFYSSSSSHEENFSAGTFNLLGLSVWDSRWCRGKHVWWFKICNSAQGGWKNSGLKSEHTSVNIETVGCFAAAGAWRLNSHFWSFFNVLHLNWGTLMWIRCETSVHLQPPVEAPGCMFAGYFFLSRRSDRCLQRFTGHRLCAGLNLAQKTQNISRQSIFSVI